MEHINAEQLAAYLSGNLSAEDRKAVDAWIAASEENRLRVEEARLLWENSGMKYTLPEVDTDQQWRQLQTVLEEEGPSGKVVFWRNPVILKVAAAITFLLVITYMLIPREAALDQVIASADTVVSVYLPDSSQVWLNKNTTIRYAGNFQKRHIQLEGEAFFHVRHDSGNPFIVATRYSRTEVLGTSFNIKEAGEEVVLTVETGRVRFHVQNDEKQEELIVEKMEEVRYTLSGGSKKSTIAQAHVALWRNNEPLKKEEEKKEVPAIAVEKAYPKRFLKVKQSAKKNTIQQSVIEGAIQNTAQQTSYRKVTLRITYTKANGKQTNTQFVIQEVIRPGESKPFKKKLGDILSGKKAVSVAIEVVSAEAL